MDKEIEQILYQVAMDVAMDYKAELNALNINATGNLQNVDFDVEINNGTYTISLILQDYWKFVENGRLPGSFPNIGQLQQWIQIKQILPRPMANGKLPTEKQLVFMIGNSIKEKGIQPKPALDNALKKNETHLNKIKEAVSKSLDKEIKQMLKELNK
jgi:hypothetical protein